AILHHPLIQRCHLTLTAIQRGDGNCLAPINDRAGHVRRRCWSWRRTECLLELAVARDGRGGVERQRAGKPHLIEGGEWGRPILSGLAPERVGFFALVALRKGLVAQQD